MPTLFSPTDPSGRPVLSVSELTEDLSTLVEAKFGDIRVEGELSDFSRARSGHCYFTLKDAGAQIACVMWRGFTRYVFFEPQDGMLVRVSGSATVYARRGQLQLVARSMRLAGEGALQKAFERLKRRLDAEGLFDARHKKKLPRYPEVVGLVTSSGSAALQDLLSVLQRRFPQVRVLVRAVPVQGLGAAGEIASAIEAFNAPSGSYPRPDVLIVGRGGGAAEDLQAFNEEAVARALFASKVPVISGVGHETDVSIADFVADVRAATPSMAAELAVPDRREVVAFVHTLHADLTACVQQSLHDARRRVAHLTASRAFHRPIELLRRHQQRLDELSGRLRRAGRRLVEHPQSRLSALQSRLHTLDPARPFQRGYAYVEKAGRPVRSAEVLQQGDRIRLRFADGERPATIGGAPRDEPAEEEE